MRKLIFTALFAGMFLWTASGLAFPPWCIDDTAYDSTTWNGEGCGATKNAIRDKFETIGGLYGNATIVAASGGDYTDFSTAVGAASAGDTILVYPGTYNDTITFPANNITVIGVGKANTVILQQAAANVVDFNTRTGIQMRNMTIRVTAANSLISTIKGSTGSFTAKFCNLQMTVAATYDVAALNQPSIVNVTGAGTFKQRIGQFTYTHPGDSVATGIKAAFKATTGGTIVLSGLYSGTVTTSDGALASTVMFDLASNAILEMNKCTIDVTDSTGEILTLDVAPATAWADGATITGATSHETCTIVDYITALTYQISGRSGDFTLGEVLSDGTTTADQGGAHPTVAGADEALYAIGIGYLSGSAILHEFFDNTIHVTSGSSSNTYGIYSATATTETHTAFNHIHCTGGTLNYGFLIGSGNTVTSHFDDIQAADKFSNSGTFNYIGSFTDGILDISAGLNLSAANSGTVTLTGFHAGNLTQTGNITGIGGNNPVARYITVRINTDPGADTDESFRLSFHKTDAHAENLLLWDQSFNLSYTETNGGVTATDTTDTVDSSAGLVKYDYIRFLGATAENQRLTDTPTATGLTFTAAGEDHADNTGIVKVWEFRELIQLYDADGTNEIHVKLEALSAFTGSTSIVITVEYQ